MPFADRLKHVAGSESAGEIVIRNECPAGGHPGGGRCLEKENELLAPYLLAFVWRRSVLGRRDGRVSPAFSLALPPPPIRD